MLDDTNRLLVYIGKQVARHNKSNDLNFIANLLASVSEAEFKAKSAITFIEWINSDALQVVNSQTGVIPDPHDMSFREHVQRGPIHPWKLQVSKPDIGIPSGLWVVPAGTGIVDEKNKFLGVAAVGFSVAGLTSKLIRIAAIDEASFVILDKDFNIISQSDDHRLNPKSTFYKDLFSRQDYFIKEESVFEKTIKYHDIEYYAYRKMHNYPYIVMVGYNKELVSKDFYALVLPRVLEIAGMAIFCVFLLYLFRKRMVLFSNSSTKAKEDFLRKFGGEFQSLLFNISSQAEVLLMTLQSQSSLALSKMMQIELLQNISESAHNLQKLTTNTLQLTQLKINDLLQDCALIHSQAAFLQGKKIVCKLQDNMPLFCADELRFKQIILGLLSLSLKCTKQGSLIVISSALHIDGDKQYLAIGIKDDGIGLSTKELQRLRDKLQLKSFDSQLDGTGLDIEEIIKLVELHEGTYSEKSKIGEGKEIILTFPLSTEKELITNKIYSEKREDNVYMFTKKNIQE
ncbi:MAG: hypothetical protein K2Q34_00880 [Alphaproteobacteria bacterium]|nr:hypothetical protein [Alphaproteobacteria bacterium]